MSTAAPDGDFVVTTTDEATVGAGVMVPDTVTGVVPEMPVDGALVVRVMVDVAA